VPRTRRRGGAGGRSGCPAAEAATPARLGGCPGRGDGPESDRVRLRAKRYQVSQSRWRGTDSEARATLSVCQCAGLGPGRRQRLKGAEKKARGPPPAPLRGSGGPRTRTQRRVTVKRYQWPGNETRRPRSATRLRLSAAKDSEALGLVMVILLRRPAENQAVQSGGKRPAGPPGPGIWNLGTP
jgi:hypothetical protein